MPNPARRFRALFGIGFASACLLLVALPVQTAHAAGAVICEAPFLPGNPATFEGAGGMPEDPPNCAGWNCALPVLELSLIHI